jgi:high-affinity nickel-transport protein
MELAVGIMLIVLGAANVKSFFTSVPGSECVAHSHPHRHGDYVHSHVHTHQPEHHQHTPDQTPLARLDRVLGKFKSYKLVRPLVIGVVHGLAGSAAIALLVLATIPNTRWALAYLLVFGAGTVAGMMVITMSIASTFRLVQGGERFSRRLAGIGPAQPGLRFGSRISDLRDKRLAQRPSALDPAIAAAISIR